MKNLKLFCQGSQYYSLPVDSTTFELGNLPGFKMIFDTDENGEVTVVTSSQPDGSFKANKTSNEIDLPSDEAEVKLNVNEMKKYEGSYEFAPGNEVRIYIKDGDLKALIKGQPEYTLIPVAKNEFNLKGLQGFKFIFDEQNGKLYMDLTSSEW